MEKLCPFLILSSILIVAAISIPTEEAKPRNKTPDETLHFYVQDVVIGQNATNVEVARANITAKSSSFFGEVRVMDNLITSEPDAHSNKLGQAQGMLAASDLKEVAFFVDIVFMFNGGQYKGSSLSVEGRYSYANKVRELVVTGGTGVFRMIRGYATSSTYKSSMTRDRHLIYGILEFNVSLYHSC